MRAGSRRSPFSVRIPSFGIKEITFYLDGHKLKTLKASQAKHGEFSLTINPSKLSLRGASGVAEDRHGRLRLRVDRPLGRLHPPAGGAGHAEVHRLRAGTGPGRRPLRDPTRRGPDSYIRRVRPRRGRSRSEGRPGLPGSGQR